MTALENIAVPLELAGIDDAHTRAARELAAVGLAERRDHYPAELSGGEQQRVALARAFVSRPPLLFADEPTGSLDAVTGERIIELMFELNRDAGSTLVLVTHDRSLLDRLCTDILGLDGQGGARLFADYMQWTAAQRDLRAASAKSAVPRSPTARAPRAKPRRLTYPEQRDWDAMEERILAAEEAVAARQQEVEAAGQGADHVRLQECCRALQAAQESVEDLYRRWQELEAKQT